jgi:ribosomal protein S12 methylthiotransferase
LRKFVIETLGCPKNEYDSSVLAHLLKVKGHEVVEDVSNATDVVVNTCAFITEAKKQSLEVVFEFLELKKERKDFRVYIYGCLAQRYFEEILKEIPEVDGVIGLCDLEFIATELASKEKVVLSCESPVTIQKDFHGRFLGSEPFAYVKIGDGCDRNCAFCSIPGFKGRHLSRKLEDIIEEIEILVKNGKKEIILVDQDITQFRDSHGNTLLELLKQIDSIDGDFWVRTMYLHPDHITVDMVKELAKLKKWIHYLDIPIQHGSDKILKNMGRIKSKRELFEMFKVIREEIPDVVLRSSFIIGFPGETEEDFEEMLEAIEKIGFERFGFFAYSNEEGTFASTYKNKVPRSVVRKRFERANDFAANFLQEVQSQNIGKRLRVLVETFDSETNRFIGRSYMDAPEVDTYVYIKNCNRLLQGDWVNVEIQSLYGVDLEGSIVK